MSLWRIGGSWLCKCASARAMSRAMRSRWRHCSGAGGAAPAETARHRSRVSSAPPEQSSSSRQRFGPSVENANSRHTLGWVTLHNVEYSASNCLVSQSDAPSVSRLTATRKPKT